jgi:uncharacterized protein
MDEIKYKDVMIKIIEIFFPHAKVYLFGSYARGTNKPGSDIDIAIDAGRRLTLQELQLPALLLDALPMSQKIDLVDVNRVPPEMYQAILREGVAWKH